MSDDIFLKRIRLKVANIILNSTYTGQQEHNYVVRCEEKHNLRQYIWSKSMETNYNAG